MVSPDSKPSENSEASALADVIKTGTIPGTEAPRPSKPWL
jgi:hypothetical protein